MREIVKLSPRQSRLVSILLKQTGYRTVRFYADELNFSERTIHSDLRTIEKFLLTQGYELEKKPGIGVRANRTEVVEPETDEALGEKEDYSTAGRRKKMMEMMLFEHKTVTFEQLSEHFLVSRSSIRNDLNAVEKKLTYRNGLRLISDGQGTRFTGREKDWQRAFLEFNRFVLEDGGALLENDEERKLELLSEYYGADTVSVCSRVLYSYLKADAALIADYYAFNVLSMMIVLAYRMQGNHYLDKEHSGVRVSGEASVFEQGARDMLDKISLRLNTSYTDGEVEYLSAYLISNKFEALPTENDYYRCVERIIRQIGDSLNFNFEKDERLKEQLLLHFPSMIYRLRAGIPANNPFVYQIKNEFAVIFNIVWVVLGEHEEELNVAFNEDEIGFLTIHFQAAVERAKLGRKILVICPKGIATSELLVNRIKNVLPAFDRIEVASAKEAEKYDYYGSDLIVSTVNLNIPGRKAIVVSPLLTDQDMKNITDFYNEKFVMAKPSQAELGPLLHLARYVREEFIYFDGDFASKEELIDEVGGELVRKGIVSGGFVDSMKSRESLGGTDLPTGAAIPHGSPKHVNETAVLLIRNRKNIGWNANSVKTVIMICIAEKDTRYIKNVLSDIYRIVESKELLSQIHTMSDKHEFMKKIGCGTA